MKVYNNTDFSPAQIENLPLLFTVKNNWRQRNIRVYQHPEKTEGVISVGISFQKRNQGNGKFGFEQTIAEETYQDWQYQINQTKYGQKHFVVN